MIRMGVSELMFLLVPAYPGIPGHRVVKRLCECVPYCMANLFYNLQPHSLHNFSGIIWALGKLGIYKIIL